MHRIIIPNLAMLGLILTLVRSTLGVQILHNDTILFEDDFEVGYGPGFDTPRYPIPWIGSWGTLASSATNGFQVYSEPYQTGRNDLPIGGAFQGNEYLRVYKSTGNTSRTITGIDVNNGIIRIRFMLYVPRDVGTWNQSHNAIISFILYESQIETTGNGDMQFWVNVNRDNNAILNVLSVRGDGSLNQPFVRKGTSDVMTWTADTWQEWEFTFTFSPEGDSIMLTLDGVESEPGETVFEGFSAKGFQIRPNSANTNADNLFFLDAVSASSRPRMIGHYDFVEPGDGPWQTATDKVGPVFYSPGTTIGGGNLNLVDVNGVKAIDVGGDANQAVTLEQGDGNEFDVDFSGGLSVQAIMTLTNLTARQFLVSKDGSLPDRGFALLYMGTHTQNQRIALTLSEDGNTTAFMTLAHTFGESDLNTRWLVRADYIPSHGRRRITLINLDDARWFLAEANIAYSSLWRHAFPLVLGAGSAFSNPLHGTLGDVRIYGEGFPPIPQRGTLILLR